MAPVMDETNGISPVPPGFVSLKSFTLQRVQDGSLASKTANDPRKTMIDDESSATDVVKLRKSLRYRPWVNYCQFDKSSDEESDSELSDQDAPSIRCLPKGVIRGCTECGNCQKVIARWRPEESCRPMLDDAPVFYPSEEEFKDTLKYIASIRPTAESYGICRIVPPPSWKPSCPLKEKIFWEGSNFTTRIQRVDKLQNRDTVKKLLRNHSMMKRKRRRLAKMNAAFGENNVDILEINETGPYSQRFGFAQGPDFTLDSFQKYADHFKEQYFCSSLNANISSEQWEPSIENIEGEYWRIVEHPTEEIEVLYGADLETGMFGSGFPKATSGSLDSVDWYAKSSWNLNNVPRLPGSVLAFESGEISGVLVPWLYVGMCFSSFCWHVEDHHLYSVNYLHWGAPKIWYGVPGREALNLEAAMKKHLTDLFEDQPNLLHNLVTQFSPSILKLESVPVYRCIQHPGEFVLTFPRAYHSGFNCGFNCAEAVNIAPVDWLPHGQNAVELYCEQMRKITISHDKLLLGAAREAVRALWNVLFLKEDTPENRVWKDTSGPVGILAKSLKARVELERTRREHLSSSQIRKMDPAFDAESERECVLCHFDLHLSAAGCPCSPDKFACLVHAKHLCSCDWKTRFFLFRYEITELNTLSDAVGGKLSAVHKWGVQDLKLSLSSYVNKEKSYQSRFSDQDCSEAKGNEKVSMSLGFSASSKNTNSAQVVMGSVLKHFSAETKASTKILPVDSTSVITNTTLCQRMMSTVPSATKEPCLQDNSSLKVKHAENLQTTEVCISSYDKSSEECMVNTKAMRSIANGRNYFGYSLLEQDVKQQCHINSGVSSAGNNIAASKDDSLLYNVGNRREQIIPLNLGKDKPNSGENSRNLTNFDGKETICNFPNKHVSVLPKLCPAVDNQRDDKQDGLKSIAHGLMPSSLEPNEQGKGDSSGNCSSNSASHSPVVSIAQVASDHKKCVNTSIGRHVFDLLEAKEVGECGTKPARSDQKQQCSGSLTGSSNAEEFNKVGKVSESDSLNSCRDNGDLAETCSSFPLNTVHRQNHMQKGPRIAKVVRRINYNVELLEYGVVHSGRLWSTSQAIFPKGYRSRVRYWSILDPTQMCYYVSEILDAEPLGPLFMIKLEQSPSEIFFHVCATKCWNIVRERVNNEIRRLHNLGRVNLPSLQPPGSVDGLEMFGLTFPTIIQAIEAMDKNRICSEYWKSRPKIPNPYDGVDQRAISTSLESKGPLQPVLTGAAAKLKSLFKKASSEELHALYLTLMMDEPGSKHDLLELIKEENQSRLGFDL